MACRQRSGLPSTETPAEGKGKDWRADEARRSQVLERLWNTVAGTAISNIRKIAPDKQKNEIARSIA